MEELAIRIIEALPASVRRLTADTGEEELRKRPAPGEWSVVEIVGHLIDSTDRWGERLRRIASEDRPRLPAYDQEARVREQNYQERPLDELLDRLTQLAEALARDLRRLSADAWTRSGIHEERGVMTLGEACRVYVADLPNHVAQLVATRDAATAAAHLPGRP